MALSQWVQADSFGLTQRVWLPNAVQFALGFLLMDLTFYYWHMANHKIAILWRFHNVHHIDPDMDVSTSFRFHFGEVLYSTGFRAIQVCLLGIAPVTYIVYEAVFQCATMFHHSNLRLPIRVEHWLNVVIVTPRMHGIHHSQVRNEMDSNYSVIFRWWDLLNRTLRLNIRQSDIDIGVAGYRQKGDNGLLKLFALPFIRQRKYWRLSDGTAPKSNQIETSRESELLE
jgi:sterol desaturase/sphingolipid hydroxylase (fatty acid hydroxylase superfamily)